MDDFSFCGALNQREKRKLLVPWFAEFVEFVSTFTISVCGGVWSFSCPNSRGRGNLTETYLSSPRLNRTSSWHVNHALVLSHVALNSQFDSTGTGLELKFQSEIKINSGY